MKTKLVTSLYTGISDYPFYGHESFSRHERYLHSLRTLNNVGVEIVCFTNENQFDLVKSHCNEYNLKNVIVKISNLSDYPLANKMKSIKDSTNNFKFYHEIDWNKFYLLEKEYDESYDYIYWIDVGLSHRGLFLEKYNPYADKIDGLSRTYENYSFLGIFNNNFINGLNSWVDNKLINLSNMLMSHNISELNYVMEENRIYKSLSVGGIIGGHKSLLKWYIEEFNNISHHVLNKNVILNHESMMSNIYEKNKENFRTFFFETWYHDDYWKTTPYFDRESIKDRVHFVHFFEKELKL